MNTIRIPGLASPVSQLVLGSAMLSPDRQEQANELLDAYVELGGNAVDTAFVYGGGKCEIALGNWLKARGNRGSMVVIAKGAHPDHSGPRVNPVAIAADLSSSLERMGLDYADIYMLHRDDPAVPVNVIVDTLNIHVRAGRIRVLGTSNWTARRIDEANEYARASGQQGFVCNSPNLSLAKPIVPMWPNSISVDDEYREWHERNQMPLISWSSQSAGFFSGKHAPDRTDDEVMAKVYYCVANWERLRRARYLAKKKKATATQIALAYVLHQQFPICALVGPASVAELNSSYGGMNVTLTQEQVRWLDLRD